jgi:hypothetical protein
MFKTDLFVFEQRDKDIDHWFVGADCAGWFYARLLPFDGIKHSLDPLMEDWGWTFSVAVNAVEVYADVWAFYGINNCWLFGIAPKKRLFRSQSPQVLAEAKQIVCNALESIICADQRFVKHEWFAENPWDLDLKQF